MKKYFALAALISLTACGGGKGEVSYDHKPGAVCPGPIGVSQQVSMEFNQYADNPLMQQFYKHYLAQQRELTAFQQHMVPNCPPAFWVQDNVAAEFAKLPEGDPLREFFNNYVIQQRALDAYYTPAQPVK